MFDKQNLCSVTNGSGVWTVISENLMCSVQSLREIQVSLSCSSILQACELLTAGFGPAHKLISNRRVARVLVYLTEQRGRGKVAAAEIEDEARERIHLVLRQ